MSLEKLLRLDARATERVRIPDQRGPLFSIAALFARSGDSWLWLAALGIIWLFSPQGSRTYPAVMAGGLIFLAAFVLVIKFTVRRKRPQGDWGAIYRNTDPHSFPSGHASRAAMLAVVALGFQPVWIGWLLLIWAPCVCIARVATGVHYLSDVIAGAILGSIVGGIILLIYPFFLPFFAFLL